jgi:UDP-N-acetylglucosamine--dolichyl-phosphate N-acetylglucosaminephosphotransferase
LNKVSGKLENSWTMIKPKHLRSLSEKFGVLILVFAEKFKLVRLKRDNDGNGDVIGSTNLTILNLILLWKGETREDGLCLCLISIQIAASLVGFTIRYGLGGWIYGNGGDRR